MTHTTAKQLLDRYFLGETTVKEELELRAYFRAGDIHPDLAIYPPLFTYWEEASEIKAPVRIRSARRRTPVRWLSVAAAAALLLFGLNTWFDQDTVLTNFPVPTIADAQPSQPVPIDWSKYEVTDPEEAYKILRGALKTASTELNRGTRITLRELEGLSRALK